MECQALFSASAEETLSIGKRISALLCPPSVIALKGELGSGKTQLAKGIAAGLGVGENITSPTYTIISEYAFSEKGVLYHIDAYRIEGDRDFEDIGGTEILSSDGICIIEWSDRIQKSIPDSAVKISFEITGETSRKINIEGLDKL